jgi:monoamine oxidase
MIEKLKTLWQYDWFKVTSSVLLGIVVGVVFYPSKIITERETSKLKETYELKISEMQKTHNEESAKLNEKLTAEESVRKSLETETSKKIEILTTENRSLKQSSKKQKFKLVKPDGTIIEKEMEQSNSEEVSSVVSSIKEEFNQKVKSIEERWKKVHEERVVELKKKFDQDIEKVKSEQKVVEKIVEKEKIVEVNKKKLRPEVGASYDGTKDVKGYFHLSYPVAGPVFIGGGVSGSKTGFGDVRLGLGLEL